MTAGDKSLPGLAAQLVPLREVASHGTLATEREWKPWDREMASPWRKVGYALPAWEAVVLAQEFSSTVGHRVELPAERVEAFAAALRDLTAGDVLVDVIDRDP